MPWAVCSEVTVPAQRHGPAGLDGARGVVLFLADDAHALADADAPVADATDRHAADVVVGGQVRHQQLQGMPGLVLRRGSDLDQQVEQGLQVRAGLARSRVAVPALALV